MSNNTNMILKHDVRSQLRHLYCFVLNTPAWGIMYHILPLTPYMYISKLTYLRNNPIKFF